MTKKLFVLATLTTLAVFTSFAHADSIQSWCLTGSNPGGPPCTPGAPCAEVTLDINGAGTQATFTVSSLLNGYIFDNFGFNASGHGLGNVLNLVGN